MLDEYLSPALQRSLRHAEHFARQRGASAIHPEDLLTGLLVDDGTRAAQLLLAAGFAVAKVVENPTALATHPLPLSGPARTVLTETKALGYAAGGDAMAGSDELLVALIQKWPEMAGRLAERRLEPKSLLEQLRGTVAEPVKVDVAGLVLAGEDAAAQTDMARIVDANLNRAREALRVVEDYARFALDDEALAHRLKAARHELRRAVAFLPETWFAPARETRRDVGVDVKTSLEYHRAGLIGVVAANCKRAQEALRSLEEVAKTENYFAAESLEKLRYEVYDLERRIRILDRARDRLRTVVLSWLLDPNACVRAVQWTVREAIAGGVDSIQLRLKGEPDRAWISWARTLRQWTSEMNVLLIINDRPDIARLVAADGVQVGQEDLGVKDVRRIVGPDALIGVSTHAIDEARQALADGADYLGVGPTFPSLTKRFAAFPGLDYLCQVAREITLPAFAIGGINVDNVSQVVAAGGKRVAVAGAINQANEPRSVAMALRQRLGS